MAIFIQGTSDVFAGVTAVNLDFDRIEKMLKLRQNMYDEGAKKVKSLYDSVFNSAMLRDGNIDRRDKYLKTITESLNNLSAMDLSLVQNQQFASTLFSPVLNDKSIVKDMSFTKAYQNELSTAESYRTATDETTRKRYWLVGAKALQYQAEDFMKADDQTALTMSAPKYVPQIDLLKVSEKAFKESGISVKEDVINGGYIFTKKNGESVFPVTQSYVETLFQSDPGIAEMFKTQAYVQRRDFIKQNATKFGGEEKAEAFYLSQILTNAGYGQEQKYQKANLNLKELQLKKESWDKIIKERGIVPGSAEHDEYLNDLEKLKVAEATVNGIDNTLFSNETLDFNNINYVRAQADNLVMLSNYTSEVNRIAKFLALKNAEISIKADPISLAQLRSNLSLRNSQIMESIRQSNRIEMLNRRIAAGAYSSSNNKKKKTEDDLVNTPDDQLTEEQKEKKKKILEKRKKRLNSESNVDDAFNNFNIQQAPWNPFGGGTYDPYQSTDPNIKKIPLKKSNNLYVHPDADDNSTNNTNTNSSGKAEDNENEDILITEQYFGIPDND